jgi:hypothetical protein
MVRDDDAMSGEVRAAITFVVRRMTQGKHNLKTVGQVYEA